MPRKPRLKLAGMPVHVVQRGNNRQAVFYDEQDHRAYLRWLKEGAERYGCAIHAYVLMTNHVHLLLTPEREGAIGRLLQYLGRYYVLYINHRYGRSGTLWEGRYKASLIQEEDYLLACYRYIELNPVRAGMADGPGAYPWSSYHRNALGQPDPVIVSHRRYRGLGQSELQRQEVYRGLFTVHVNGGQLTQIRETWQTGTPLGNDRFKEQVEAMVGRKIGHARRGRPKKTP